jgi:uncharacterized membrane protein (UPF0127 family)
LFAAVLLAPVGAPASEKGTIVFKTETGEHSFDIEVMTTVLERAKGLMFRHTLPERSGMLFVYDRPQATTMWMKNTYIPLDMVFIAAGGTVHRIEANTEPFSTALISSEGDIIAVLELNAGEAARIGLKPGDRAIYPGLGQAR